MHETGLSHDADQLKLLLAIKPIGGAPELGAGGRDIQVHAPAVAQCEDGLLQFRTRPWGTAEQFLTHRQKFDKWVKSGNTPRTVGDYARFQQWAGRDHRGLHRDQQARTDFEQAVITMCAQGSCGLAVWNRQHRDGLTRQRLAEILTNCGLPVTERALDARALRNAKPVEGAVTILTDRDLLLWAELEAVIGGGPLTRLLAI